MRHRLRPFDWHTRCVCLSRVCLQFCSEFLKVLKALRRLTYQPELARTVSETSRILKQHSCSRAINECHQLNWLCHSLVVANVCQLLSRRPLNSLPQRWQAQVITSPRGPCRRYSTTLTTWRRRRYVLLALLLCFSLNKFAFSRKSTALRQKYETFRRRLLTNLAVRSVGHSSAPYTRKRLKSSPTERIVLLNSAVCTMSRSNHPISNSVSSSRR